MFYFIVNKKLSPTQWKNIRWKEYESTVLNVNDYAFYAWKIENEQIHTHASLFYYFTSFSSNPNLAISDFGETIKPTNFLHLVSLAYKNIK